MRWFTAVTPWLLILCCNDMCCAIASYAGRLSDGKSVCYSLKINALKTGLNLDYS